MSKFTLFQTIKLVCADQHKCEGGKTHYTKGFNPAQQLLPLAELFIKVIQNSYECQNSLFFKLVCADQHQCVGGKTHYTKFEGLNPKATVTCRTFFILKVIQTSFECHNQLFLKISN
jgi:hypothetical protein